MLASCHIRDLCRTASWQKGRTARAI